MAKRTILTATRLRELLNYDQYTGKFSPVKPSRRQVVGWIANHGYGMICVDGKPYLQHRLAFLWMTGDWPPIGTVVDHINGIRTDNRWINLRLASYKQNNWSRRGRGNGGHVGVYYRPENIRNPWIVQLDNKYIGSYATEQQAIDACANKIREIRGQFGGGAKARRDWLIVGTKRF